MTQLTQLVPLKSEMIKNSPRFQDFRMFGSDIANLVSSQRESIDFGLLKRKLKTERLNPDLALKDGNSIITSTEETSFEEKIFNSLVELKVSVSQYAMHLSPAVRDKIFSDLESLLNVEDWHEDDILPRFFSFRDFLKWTIYSKRFNWLSLGFSDEGNILAAWKSDKGMLTASYDGAGRVWWTLALTIDGELNHVAGDSTLEYFEMEARRLD